MSSQSSTITHRISDDLKALDSILGEFESAFRADLYQQRRKLQRALQNMEENKPSIAFFGSFSDGKSTILSALMRRMNIDISPEPTTDKLALYVFDSWRIIDTPGLFSEHPQHDECTRQYISEADAIIYTVDPINPLKASHAPVLKWLLSDLNKAEVTVFAVNKMDQVAELEDDADFQDNAAIKKEVVLDTVRRVTGKDHDCQVVCVAANPYDMELSFWKEKEDEYLRLSRMEDLRETISRLTKRKTQLQEQSALSTLEDVREQVLAELNEAKAHLESRSNLLAAQIKEYATDAQRVTDKIRNAYDNIQAEFLALRESILTKIRTAPTQEELIAIAQNEIGEDGYVLLQRTNLIVRRHTESLTAEIDSFYSQLGDAFNNYLKSEEEVLEAVSDITSQLLRWITAVPERALADTILAIRNALNLPIKFKPWGAVNLANRLQGGASILGTLLTTEEIYANFTLKKTRNEMSDEIDGLFRKLLETLMPERYLEECFPWVKENEKRLAELNEKKREVKRCLDDIDRFASRLETLRPTNPADDSSLRRER